MEHGTWEFVEEIEQYPCENLERYPYEDLEKYSCVDLLQYVGGKSRILRSSASEIKKSSLLCFHRILTDLKELQNDEFSNVSANIPDDDIYKWNISFPAPNGKSVRASLQFNCDYPLVPPKMIIKQRIFHPNISMRGEVCLHLNNNWTPAHSIWSLILSVQCLLLEPNPLDALNPLAAKAMIESRDEFEKYLWGSFEMLDLFNDEEINYQDELKTVSSEKNEIKDSGKIEEVHLPCQLDDREILALEKDILLQRMIEEGLIS